MISFLLLLMTLIYILLFGFTGIITKIKTIKNGRKHQKPEDNRQA